MGHEYIKENDTFSTSRNGTVPKPTASDVSNNKVLRADGNWVSQSGGGGGGSSTLAGLDDVDTTGVSDGDLLGYDSNSNKWIPHTPSSGHIYSTTEQVVGTWIDGKPLYEKTVNFGAIAANTINYQLDCSILTVDNLIDMNCMIYSSNNFIKLPLALFQQGLTYSDYGINIQAFDKTTGKVRIDTGASRSISGGYITLQYTKTTDQ